MNYTEDVSLLPSSIYKKVPESNVSRFWKLFAGQLETLENAQLHWYDRNEQSGVQLDRIGRLKGIYRDGLGDDDYRFELSLPRSVKIITLPALYEAASTYGSDVRIQELHSPYQFELVLLNNERILDGSFNLDPSAVPVVKQRLDATWLLDGTEPLEGFGIRSLGILIQLTVSADTPFNLIYREMKRLLAGITLYLGIKVIMETEVFYDLNFSVMLDASKVLDGSFNLNTSVEAVFLTGNTEIYRAEAAIYPDKVTWISERRKAQITKVRLERSGAVLFEKEMNFSTGIFEQYEFELRQKV